MGWGDQAAAVSLQPEWAWVWRAWRQMHSGRRWLAGVGPAAPLPLCWSEIQEWSERHALDGDAAEDLHHLITAMDVEYQDIEAAKRAAAT